MDTWLPVGWHQLLTNNSDTQRGSRSAGHPALAAIPKTMTAKLPDIADRRPTHCALRSALPVEPCTSPAFAHQPEAAETAKKVLRPICRRTGPTNGRILI